MAITARQFGAVFPKADARTWAAAVSAAWQRYGFVTANARAGYLGICGNETGGFVQVKRENMRYTAERAAQVFRKARAPGGGPTALCREKVAAGPKAFASWIYAGIIGNGDESSGDGWTYRGGGIIQLTGRGNYKACGDALGVDLVEEPDSLTADPARSAAAAAWFMAVHRTVLPLLDGAAEKDFLAAARKVGLPPDAAATERRLAYRAKALEALWA